MARETLLPNWNRKFLDSLNRMIEELYNKKVTSSDINVIQSKLPTDSKDSYPSGVSIFNETQDTEVGKAWINSIQWVVTGGIRLMMETNVSRTVAIQRVHVIQTAPATQKVLGIFERGSYATKGWGDYVRIDNATNEDLILVSPKKFEDTLDAYDKGFTIFSESQDTENGKIWLAALPERYTGGFRMFIETNRTAAVGTQTIKIIRTRPATFQIIDQYSRNAYASEGWGELKKQSENQLFRPIQPFTELFDPSKLRKGMYYHYSNGKVTFSNYVHSIGPFKVKAGGIYEKGFQGHIAFFDKNMNYVSGLNGQLIPYRFTVPANGAEYMFLSFNSSLSAVSLRYIEGQTNSAAINSSSLVEDEHVVMKRLIDYNPVVRSKVFVPLPTPYDDGTNWSGRTHQATHPSCQAFDKEWHGYRYWMGFTPYPYARSKSENPCIVASNDGVKWEVPSGTVNPLGEPPDPGYNSDTHLLYNEKNDCLELWYRAVIGGNKQEELLRVVSSNGTSWSKPESMLVSSASSVNILQYIAPSIIFEENKYKMWIMRDWYLYYSESADGKNWGEFTPIFTEGNPDFKIHSWHGCVQKHQNVYYLINCDKYTNQGNGGELFYHTSFDGINWSTPYPITSYSKNEWQWDSAGVYRGSILFMDEKIHLYYGMYSSEHQWTIGGAAGRDIYHLEGFTKEVMDHYYS